MNSRTVILIVAGIVIALIVYRAYLPAPGENGFKSVSPKEFYSLMQKDGAFLIDVHIPEQKHLPGTDAWIPYNRIEEMKNDLPEDKNTLILVYCRSGHMSKIAASKLVEMGYRNVYELDNGIIGWQRAGLPI